MTTNEKLNIIKSRLATAFSPLALEVIDESDRHIGHAGHQGGGRHFAIIMNAPALHAMSRVDAHRKIYALFEDLIPDEIHALKIKLKK